MSSEIWPQLRYHATQAEVLACQKRFLFIAAGRQSGKTELALRNLVCWLPVHKPWPRPQYFYTGPTLKQAKRVAWDRLLGLIPEHWIADISLTDDRIKTVFGSELFLDGLDAPHRIEGQILDGGIIDENADVRPETFGRSVLGTLVTRHGWCWRIGVCKRFGIGAVEFRENFKKAAEGELPNAAAFTWKSSGVVTEEELEIARASMDERTFDEQYNATWLTESGGIFYAFDKEFNVRPCAYNPSNAIIVAQDFNVNPMCWILCHRRGDILEVFDEIWLRNTNTPEALRVLAGRYSDHKGGFQFYGDATCRGRKITASQTDYYYIVSDEQFKAMGRTIHFDKSNPLRADRFAETNARICSGDGVRHVFISPKCEHLICDLETRVYKPGTRESDDSDTDVGHMTDALGYVIHKLWPLQLIIQNSNIITISQGV